MYLKEKVLLFGGNKGFDGHWYLIKQEDNFLTEELCFQSLQEHLINIKLEEDEKGCEKC